MKRRRKRIRPDKIIDRSATPVYMVSSDRRILLFNSGCEKLTGWPAEEVVGQLCEFVTDAEAKSLEALAASLCPPAEAFEGHVASVTAHVVSRAGDPSERLLNFLPLLDDEGKMAAVLVMIAERSSTDQIAEPSAAQQLHAELASLRMALRRRFGTQSLICRSEGMLRVAEQMTIARETRAAVLISGERGSGKEHVARAIHSESEWQNRAFVPLDCQRLSALELEQTLRRLLKSSPDDGYFTSALQPGTIFLLHVEHCPRDLQKTISESFRRELGKQRDLRLIASTTLEPAALADADVSRPDFYHLLTPLCIALPPLRKRTEDLRHLAQHLLEELNRGDSRQFNGFADDVWEKFTEYNWPGNVDELLTVIQEARAICNEPLIRNKDLPFRFRTGLNAQEVGPVLRPQVAPLEPFLAQAEREQIEQALKQCHQNKSQAAQLLGMTRPRLYRRMEILGIRDELETK